MAPIGQKVAKAVGWFVVCWAIGMLWIVGAATAFVAGRWCAQLLGWY